MVKCCTRGVHLQKETYLNVSKRIKVYVSAAPAGYTYEKETYTSVYKRAKALHLRRLTGIRAAQCNTCIRMYTLFLIPLCSTRGVHLLKRNVVKRGKVLCMQPLPVSVKYEYEKTSHASVKAWLVFQNQIFIYVERQRSGACAGNKAVAQSSPLDASIGALVRTHVR